MHNFVHLLNKVNNGVETSPRGLKVKQIWNDYIVIDPIKPYVDFNERPFNFRYFAAELAWYLKQDTNTQFITKHSSFWNQLKNIKNEKQPEGHINSNYGKLMLGEQLIWAFNSLVNDKHSRQAVCFLNQPSFQFEGNKDFVCTMYVNFWINDDKLNMKVQMRSNDLFYGFTYDVPWFSFIQHQMLLNLKNHYHELEIGEYYHAADNFHFYERHFQLAEKILFEKQDNTIIYKMINPTKFIEITDASISLSKDAQTFMDLIYKENKEDSDLQFFEELKKYSIVSIK